MEKVPPTSARECIIREYTKKRNYYIPMFKRYIVVLTIEKGKQTTKRSMQCSFDFRPSLFNLISFAFFTLVDYFWRSF